MPDISITVTDKRPVCTAGTTVVCDNSDYIVHWDLDAEWSAYDTKTMRVIYMDSTYADIVFSGDSVALPPVPVPGCVQIGLYAGDIHTSRMALLRALSSVRSASGAPANPTPDVYDQLMELIKGLGGVDPDDIAKAVADYLAAHPVEETDPTVPEWAKAETKPTYSAAEVGAISQSDLQAATDTALAQAKASGEFDGPQGPAGAPGKDGAGMDITGATVGQITKITAVDASGKPTAWEAINHTWTLHQTYNLKDLTFPAAISIPQKKDVYILLEGTDITPDKNTNVNITMATTSQVGGYGNRGEFSQKLHAHDWGSGMMMLLLWRDNAASFKQYRTGWFGGYEYTPYKETLEWMDTGRLYLRITVDDATKLNANTTATIKVYTRDYI